MAAVSVDLQGIPEIEEINQVIEHGILAPFEFLEATLPPLTPQMRASLKQYLSQIEDKHPEYMTELLEDEDTILITIVPPEFLMLALSASGQA